MSRLGQRLIAAAKEGVAIARGEMMLCPCCHGKREVIERETHMLFRVPCPYCKGEGVINCCEGDKENETDESEIR